MRAFIAIDFPSEVKREIVAWRGDLVKAFPSISWIPEENLHLTLKFLGVTRQERAIKQFLETLAARNHSLLLEFSHPGFFQKSQLLLFLSLKRSLPLLSLIEQLEEGMTHLGLAKEKRTHVPHVTIGRGRNIGKKDAVEIQRFLVEKSSPPRISFSASQITFFESILTRIGPRYTPLACFSLLPVV